jgi:hypothetical protein
VNAHAYVALIAQGRYPEAMEVIMRNLPLPGVIGRICPHPCETACRRGEVDEPLAICALKRFVADQVDIEQLPMPQIEKRTEKVAIIGSGPAGLSAAYFLALDGCHHFEALRNRVVCCAWYSRLSPRPRCWTNPRHHAPGRGHQVAYRWARHHRRAVLPGYKAVCLAIGA